MSTSIIISIKPVYAEKIFQGKKTIELRRKLPKNINKGDLILVYISSPEKVIYGAFSVKKILYYKIDELWKKINKKAAVTLEEFNDYFANSEYGYGIEINDVWKFNTPLHLDEIRYSIEDFNVPQSFRYTTSEDIKLVDAELQYALGT